MSADFRRVEHQVEVAPGDVRTFHELTMRGYRQLQGWLNRLPRPEFFHVDLATPLAAAHAQLARTLQEHGVDPARAEEAVGRHAQAAAKVLESLGREARWEAGQWPPQVGSADAGRVILTHEDGPAQLVLALLRQSDPKATPEQAEQVVEDMPTAVFLNKLVPIAFGNYEAAADERPAPKGE